MKRNRLAGEKETWAEFGATCDMSRDYRHTDSAKDAGMAEAVNASSREQMHEDIAGGGGGGGMWLHMCLPACACGSGTC